MNLHIPKKSRLPLIAAICAGVYFVFSLIFQISQLTMLIRASQASYWGVSTVSNSLCLLAYALFFVFILIFAKRNVRRVLIPLTMLIVVQTLGMIYYSFMLVISAEVGEFLSIALPSIILACIPLGCLVATVALFYRTLSAQFNYKYLQKACIILSVIPVVLPMVTGVIQSVSRMTEYSIPLWQVILSSILRSLVPILFYGSITLLAFALREKEELT